MSARTRLARAGAAGIAACAGVALLPGCASIPGNSPSLIPNRAVTLSRSVSVPLDALALAAGAFVVIDPLAPNWRIERWELGADRYAFALVKKRFTTGGDGEAMPVLRRDIERLVADKGYAGFQILEFAEGIDSAVPIAQRVARAVVQFAASPQAFAPQAPR